MGFEFPDEFLGGRNAPVSDRDLFECLLVGGRG
jgi:hypothetical protein